MNEWIFCEFCFRGGPSVVWEADKTLSWWQGVSTQAEVGMMACDAEETAASSAWVRDSWQGMEKIADWKRCMWAC